MKYFLKLYAEYNDKTNRDLEKLMASLEETSLFNDMNTYYKSIWNLYLHLIYTSKYLQRMIRTNWDNKYFVYNNTEKEFEINPKNLNEASFLLKSYDENLNVFIKMVNDKDLIEPKVSLVLYNKKEVQVSIWEILSQYIIHQTHHRGQLSQILDEKKIDHDIGNIWPLLD